MASPPCLCSASPSPLWPGSGHHPHHRAPVLSAKLGRCSLVPTPGLCHQQEGVALDPCREIRVLVLMTPGEASTTPATCPLRSQQRKWDTASLNPLPHWSNTGLPLVLLTQAPSVTVFPSPQSVQILHCWGLAQAHLL